MKGKQDQQQKSKSKKKVQKREARARKQQQEEKVAAIVYHGISECSSDLHKVIVIVSRRHICVALQHKATTNTDQWQPNFRLGINNSAEEQCRNKGFALRTKSAVCKSNKSSRYRFCTFLNYIISLLIVSQSSIFQPSISNFFKRIFILTRLDVVNRC